MTGDGGGRRVGFVGVGAMGGPMAANLLRAGHGLTVHDLRRETAADLLGQGAAWADTPQAVASASDVVLLSLPNPADVEDVVTRTDGVLSGAAAGSTIIDLSTNSPAVVRALAAAAAERHVRFIDAPVSGGVGGARRGTLAVMAGGEADCVEEHRPLLEAIGDRVFHVGDVGAGNVVKLLNNMLFFVNLLAAVEALVVGAKAGVDPAVLQEVVHSSSGASFAWDHGARAILRDRLTPTFTMGLAAKDIGLASALADEMAVDVPMAGLARQLIDRCRDEGLAAEDVLAVVKVLEWQAGVTVRGLLAEGERT